ncbi:lipocalin, partial [Francisella tularensis subsp. holarctica]|nr:lipocalin [Francisella tularensis subsp. holarctica]
LLALTKTVPQNIKDDFINRDKALGYDTYKLVWVKQ